MEQLEQQLIEALGPFNELIKPDSYYLRVAEVKKDSVALKFQYILQQPNKDLERQIRRKTIRRLVEIIGEREKFVEQLPDFDVLWKAGYVEQPPPKEDFVLFAQFRADQKANPL